MSIININHRPAVTGPAPFLKGKMTIKHVLAVLCCSQEHRLGVSRQQTLFQNRLSLGVYGCCQRYTPWGWAVRRTPGSMPICPLAFAEQVQQCDQHAGRVFNAIQRQSQSYQVCLANITLITAKHSPGPQLTNSLRCQQDEGTDPHPPARLVLYFL